MAKRLLIVVGLWGAFCAANTAARADTIELLVNLTTGNVSLHNANASSFDIVGYSIVTNPGTLDSSPGVWTSIADTYDAMTGPTPGDGSVDPVGEWIKLTSPGSTSDLAEAVLSPSAGSLSPGQTVSLGDVWNTAVPPDPAIDVDVGQTSDPEPTFATVDVLFYLESDYNSDLIVDRDDLDILEANFGTGTLHSQGDGDHDGDVDGDDFFLWQMDVGRTGLSILGAGAGSGMLSVATVPEPATLLLLTLGGGVWFVAAQRRRRLEPVVLC